MPTGHFSQTITGTEITYYLTVRAFTVRKQASFNNQTYCDGATLLQLREDFP